MITRGIVEEVIDRFNVKVRLPLLDGVQSGSVRATTKGLRTMVMCSLPRVEMNLQVGDVVFVAFEDYSEDRAVILGCLFRENTTSTRVSIDANSLVVVGNTILTDATRIGDVEGTEIQCLIGVSDNIQRQLNALSERLDVLEKKLTPEEEDNQE